MSPFAYAARPSRDRSIDCAVGEMPSASAVGTRAWPPCATCAGAFGDAGATAAFDVPICTTTPAVRMRPTIEAMAMGAVGHRRAGAAGAAGTAGVSGARQRGHRVRCAYVFVPHAAHLTDAGMGYRTSRHDRMRTPAW